MKFGVIVARFQIDRLHSGHLDLLRAAALACDHVLLFLGVSTIAGTKQNPLDFQTRQHLIRYSKPISTATTILPIVDCESDSVWSQTLDQAISKHVKYGDSVIMFGGKDSFLNYYDGRYKDHRRLDFVCEGRATKRRKDIIEAPPGCTDEFRQGVIYAIGNTRDTMSATVDMACIKGDQLLVGRKSNEKLWRFPGGFVDYADKSLELAARREFHEETNMSIESDLHYVCSVNVDDWRFRNSPDKGIMTTLFAFPYSFGNPEAGDDLVEVKWIHRENDCEMMNNAHKKLYLQLVDWCKSGGIDVLQSRAADRLV